MTIYRGLNVSYGVLFPFILFTILAFVLLCFANRVVLIELDRLGIRKEEFADVKRFRFLFPRRKDGKISKFVFTYTLVFYAFTLSAILVLIIHFINGLESTLLLSAFLFCLNFFVFLRVLFLMGILTIDENMAIMMNDIGEDHRKRTMLMKRIKVRSNDKLSSFKFKADMLKNDRLSEIVRIFDLSEIYVDIFGVGNDFPKRLGERNSSLILASIDERSDDWTIKTNVNDLNTIVLALSEFEFEDLNIWDDRMDWEEHIKRMKVDRFSINRIEVNVDETDDGFYLNYNPRECHKTEIYCDPAYDKKTIRCRIQQMIGN